MNKEHIFLRGRFVLLTALLVFLAGTVALVYTHPDEHKTSHLPKGNYEANTIEKWQGQILNHLANRELNLAEQLTKNVLRHLPGDISFLRLLSRIYAEKGELSRAAAVCEEIIVRAPDDAITHNNMAVILTAGGEFDRAEKFIATAILLRRDVPEFRRNSKLIISSAALKQKPQLNINFNMDVMLLAIDTPGGTP